MGGVDGYHSPKGCFESACGISDPLPCVAPRSQPMQQVHVPILPGPRASLERGESYVARLTAICLSETVFTSRASPTLSSPRMNMPLTSICPFSTPCTAEVGNAW